MVNVIVAAASVEGLALRIVGTRLRQSFVGSLRVAGERDTGKPQDGFAHRVNSLSRVLASFRSSLSKPSVNQP